MEEGEVEEGEMETEIEEGEMEEEEVAQEEDEDFQEEDFDEQQVAQEESHSDLIQAEGIPNPFEMQSDEEEREDFSFSHSVDPETNAGRLEFSYDLPDEKA